MRAPLRVERPTGESQRKLPLVIGVGNRFRRDDAAGLEVARRLRAGCARRLEVLEDEGEPTSLLDEWAGADEVLLIDAVRSGAAAAGTVHRFELTEEPPPAGLSGGSTHALGVAEAIQLARGLGRLPRRLVVYGIEGERFDAGEGLSPAVEVAVLRLAAELQAAIGSR